MSLFRQLLIANSRKKKRKFYCEVEYLESTGTQWIDSGLRLTQNNAIEVCYKINSISGFSGIVGARTSASSNNISVNANTGGVNSPFISVDFNHSNFETYRARYDTRTSDKILVYLDKHIRKISINDSVVVSNNTECTDAIETQSNCLLFRTQGINGYCDLNMYYCKIWDGDTLVRHFIPVLDWDMKPAMYDKVSGQLFYNKGTGEFLYGRQIHRVEYLESAGTQYIDTGHAFTDNFSWEIDFEDFPRQTTLFGGRTSSNRTAILYNTPPSCCPIAGSNGLATPFQLRDLSTGRHKVKMSVASNKGSVWVDGTQVYNEQSFTGTYISGTTQALFADNFGTSISEYTSSKVYALKMWQGTTLVRDYIPAVDENGVGFMFDRVSHTIYDNAGQGAFSYPPVELEYLEGTGTQYIDTGINPTDSYGYKIKNTYKYRGGEQCAIGAMDDGNRFVGVYTGGTNISGGWGSFVNNLKGSYNFTDDTIWDVSCNYKNDRKIILNNEELKDVSDIHISGTINNTLYLFARHYGGTITKVIGKVYSAEITNGQDVIATYIPAFKGGKVGMYDKVSGVLYENIGTGSFGYGRIRESEYE